MEEVACIGAAATSVGTAAGTKDSTVEGASCGARTGSGEENIAGAGTDVVGVDDGNIDFGGNVCAGASNVAGAGTGTKTASGASAGAHSGVDDDVNTAASLIGSGIVVGSC